MEYFWLIFWGVIATALGAGVAVLIGWAWWIGAIIGVVIYLLCLVAFNTGMVEAAIDGLVDGFTS